MKFFVFHRNVHLQTRRGPLHGIAVFCHPRHHLLLPIPPLHQRFRHFILTVSLWVPKGAHTLGAVLREAGRQETPTHGEQLEAVSTRVTFNEGGSVALCSLSTWTTLSGCGAAATPYPLDVRHYTASCDISRKRVHHLMPALCCSLLILPAPALSMWTPMF